MLYEKKALIVLLSLGIIVSLFLSYNLIFNDKKDIRSVLSTKDLSKFENLIKQKSEENIFDGYWKYLRDVTYEYQEGIFEFKEYIKDSKERKTNSYEVFQVKIIASGNQIIFYELSIQKNKKVKYEWANSFNWEPYYVAINKFKDDIEYERFKKNF